MPDPERLRPIDPWRFEYHDPDREPPGETPCTVGNGLFVTRGAAPERVAGGPHDPGSSVAGGSGSPAAAAAP